jgi:hypothetical protein
MLATKGKAEVESRTGSIQIKVEFEGMRNSRNFGPEYLAYVLWAITREGLSTEAGWIWWAFSSRRAVVDGLSAPGSSR